jgi:methionyl aminopeptidase
MDDKKISAMRAGGKIMAQIFAELKDYTKAGMTGREISDWVEKKILDAGATVAYYEPEVNFPGSICISVNDELIHGTPKDIPFEERRALDIYYVRNWSLMLDLTIFFKTIMAVLKGEGAK